MCSTINVYAIQSTLTPDTGEKHTYSTQRLKWYRHMALKYL